VAAAEMVATVAETMVAAAAVAALPGRLCFCPRHHHFCRRRMDVMVKVRLA